VLRVGTVATASSDHPIDEKRFELVVILDQTPLELKPEMTARADVLIGTRDNVLLLPVGAVFDRGGRFVAHVVGRSGVESRAIEIGASNDYVVEVVSGLREGERVLLTDPGDGPAAPAASAPRATEERRALQPR
jgi:multidrug efflux pump subunit AcrA (membrane-fusion protein)